MAAYASGFGAAGRVKHLPLRRALEQYAGAGNRAALVKLLSPVQQAAEQRATHWIPHQWLTLLGNTTPAPTSRSRHAIARRRLSDRFAATTGRHFICAYSITFDS